jgi:hypothetical protein
MKSKFIAEFTTVKKYGVEYVSPKSLRGILDIFLSRDIFRPTKETSTKGRCIPQCPQKPKPTHVIEFEKKKTVI